MRRPSRHETPIGDCRHPGCDVKLRIVQNPRARTLTIYHGEDALAEIAPAPGHDWDALVADLTPGSADYDTIVEATGLMLVYATAELHVRGRA